MKTKDEESFDLWLLEVVNELFAYPPAQYIGEEDECLTEYDTFGGVQLDDFFL